MFTLEVSFLTTDPPVFECRRTDLCNRKPLSRSKGLSNPPLTASSGSSRTHVASPCAVESAFLPPFLPSFPASHPSRAVDQYSKHPAPCSPGKPFGSSVLQERMTLVELGLSFQHTHVETHVSYLGPSPDRCLVRDAVSNAKDDGTQMPFVSSHLAKGSLNSAGTLADNLVPSV